MHYGYRKINQKNSPLLCLPALQPETFCEFYTPYGLPYYKISNFFIKAWTIMFNLKDHYFLIFIRKLHIKFHFSRLRGWNRPKLCRDIRPLASNNAANLQPDPPRVQWTVVTQTDQFRSQKLPVSPLISRGLQRSIRQRRITSIQPGRLYHKRTLRSNDLGQIRF